jgi:hypothetical protein
MLTDMYVESTFGNKQVKVAKRTIVDVTEEDEFFEEKERFIGQSVYPRNIHKRKNGTYGFNCDINGANICFHSVKLNKGFR